MGFEHIGRELKNAVVNYEALYNALLSGPKHGYELLTLSGASGASMSAVIDTLSMRYPVYEAGRGMYALLKKETK